MNSLIQVLFIWKPAKELKEYLLKQFDNLPLQVHIPEKTESEDSEYWEQFIAEHIESAEIVIGWRPKKEWVSQFKALKLFINPGAGVQHLLEVVKDEFTKREVILVNGHGNAKYTAEHAVAMLLALSNELVRHHNLMIDGVWRSGDKEAASMSLSGKRVGLLGYGHVNRHVHQMLSGFDLHFSCCTRSSVPEGIERFSFEDLSKFLTKNDIVIIAVPETAETINMIDTNEMKLLGKEGVLINVGRGKLVNEESLYNALKSELIKGAAIDVWYNYKPEAIEGKKYPYKFAFHELKNVLLSPHRAASPFSSLARWQDVIYNVKEYANASNNFMNRVDLELGY